MVVRIRFRHGPRIGRRTGKNSKIAWIAASLLTLGSVSCLTLGVWRLGVDFGWAAEFPFPEDSFLSHWHIWLTSSLLIQVAAWKLNRYGRPRQAQPALQQRNANQKRMSASA